MQRPLSLIHLMSLDGNIVLSFMRQKSCFSETKIGTEQFSARGSPGHSDFEYPKKIDHKTTLSQSGEALAPFG